MAAQAQAPDFKSQETSESDGIPVVLKHLPDWEKVRGQAGFASNASDLKKAAGERPVFDLVDFATGTEAATAQYPAGRLVIIEYTNPQSSVSADADIQTRLTQLGTQADTIVYRRIGNYNAFVFDAADRQAADALLDQVKYEKNVRWLGNDPFAQHRAERDFTVKTADIFLSTFIAIALGLGVMLGVGGLVGYIYFRYTDKQRSELSTFSDAGGMTRLNLDGLTPDTPPERLLPS